MRWFIIIALLAAAPANAQLTMRARVTAIEPDDYVRVMWRWGGEGLGGDVVKGELTAVVPPRPKAGDVSLDTADEKDAADIARLITAVDKTPDKNREVIIQEGKTFNFWWLKKGAWSPQIPFAALKTQGHSLYLTLTLWGMKHGEQLHDVVVEFEFAYAGKVIKTFSETASDGPTVTIRIPAPNFGPNKTPTPAFLDALAGVSEYATRRAKMLESLPWAGEPVPKRFAIRTDCSGYGVKPGFMCRTADRNVILTECRSLRQLGVNGLRASPDFLAQMIVKGEGVGLELRRIGFMNNLGAIIPVFRQGFPVAPGTGCPHYPFPTNLTTWTQRQVNGVMEYYVRKLPVEEVWMTTVDEIGSVFDGAPEGKDHQGCCPYCREAFREFVRKQGLTLADFGANSWDDIRSTYGYWAKTWAERQREAHANAPKPPNLAESMAGLEMTSETPRPAATDKPGRDPDDDAIDILDEEAALAKGAPAAKGSADSSRKPPLSERGQSLLYYYSRRFNNESTAGVFTALRDALNQENEKKRQALANGDADSPVARQPWVYGCAARGNTFLMGGHSLDFFDFYRHADNAFTYETSNRDPRVWEWDSYLCDVGRTLSHKLNKRFGIYIKPHRGAPIQRAISAVSRGCKEIFWYTYGPDWWKGDGFAANPNALRDVSRAAHLIGAAEDVIYDADWAVPAEVAVVRPLTSEYFGNAATSENGKWVYEALTHAHIPVDALDEGFLLSEDLSRYKIIYISGSNIRRDVATRLVDWVKAGGVLYTSGGGLVRDEASQPLDILLPVLGLKTRSAVDLWGGVFSYGATALPGIKKLKDAPKGTKVAGQAPFGGSFDLKVGREMLEPAEGTEVLATYEDGTAAATRHSFGKGAAYVVSFYAGMEYASDILKGKWNMAVDFNADKRTFVSAPAFAAGVKPVVDASQPVIEGVLLKNNQTGAMAVTLMNWAYNGATLVPQENASVRVRTSAKVAAVRSLALKSDLAFTSNQDGIEIKIPHIEQADILLFDPKDTGP